MLDELEKELYNIEFFLLSKKASTQTFEQQIETNKNFIEKLCFYNKICTGETKVYEIQSLNSVKDVVEKLKINLGRLNTTTRQMNSWLKKGKDINLLEIL